MAQPEETTQSGRFKSAGNVIEFADDRMITSLAVTRTSLNAAIQAQAVEGIRGGTANKCIWALSKVAVS